MDFKAFKIAFKNMGVVPIVVGRASYHSISVSDDNLFLTRTNTRNEMTISLTELFSVRILQIIRMFYNS